ncbi:hypothetical protein EVAR_13014_1 [Eumeta japonica]|uniref:Uncharacterized protein n=1 Tax=Eumeta variegata TaxID=151549 RepID=A0A4C1TWX0_EUMVA|nr:hypothetical protein EVAR_13014_1 [Eumeta japonica]
MQIKRRKCLLSRWIGQSPEWARELNAVRSFQSNKEGVVNETPRVGVDKSMPRGPRVGRRLVPRRRNAALRR